VERNAWPFQRNATVGSCGRVGLARPLWSGSVDVWNVQSDFLGGFHVRGSTGPARHVTGKPVRHAT